MLATSGKKDRIPSELPKSFPPENTGHNTWQQPPYSGGYVQTIGTALNTSISTTMGSNATYTTANTISLK